VLAGHHPGVTLTNSRGNTCKPWWRFWGEPSPREKTLSCAFKPGGLSCKPYAYAEGCRDREPKLGKKKFVFSEGTVTDRCVRLVARNEIETSRDGTVETYEIGLLAFF
jgi:hypothetical protein